MVEKTGPIVIFGDANKGFTKGYGCLEVNNIVIDNSLLLMV